MGVTCSVTWAFTQEHIPTGNIYHNTQNISFNSDGSTPVSGGAYNNTDNEFTSRGITVNNPLPSGYGGRFWVTGCLAGGGIIPIGAKAGDVVAGNIISVPGQSIDLWNRHLAVFTSSDDVPTDISENGLYYKDSTGNWHLMTDGSVVATAQQVANLPQDVDFNGWVVDGEIITGSDGNYYDINGHQMFENLPSGVIPVNKITDGIFSASDGNYYDGEGVQVLEHLPSGVVPSGTSVSGVISGSDGNYYDVHGDQILEYLPSGVSPVSQIGNTFVGSDGNYYDIHGNEMFENLPSGVEIVGYDDESGNYIGDDGNYYDEDGNEVTEDTCDGVLLEAGNQVRISVDGVDIFGNDFSYFEDVPVGRSSINLGSASNFNPLKKINKIIVRNLVSGYSVGNTRLKIRGIVWGFRAGVDIDGLDPDVVIGNYTVCDCVFHTCDKYSDVVLSSDLPLGLVPNTSTIDIGFYALAGNLSLEWDIDYLTVFPYCCGSVNEDEKTSGSTNEVNSSGDLDGVIESIDKLTEAVKELSMLVEVVVSPAEDVNIYNRRFHYNDGAYGPSGSSD